MSHFRTCRSLLFLCLAVAIVPVGCARRDAGSSRWFGSVSPPRDNVFRFNNAAEPENIDPGVMSGQPDGRVARILFEGLTVQDPRTLDPVPGQARDWEVAPDGRTYTFHLRNGLRWTDGHTVTAHDFAWSWIRVLSPSRGGRYASLLFVIENAEAFHAGQLADSTRVGIQARDDSTLVVRLAHPTPYFLNLTTFYTYLPVPRWAVEKRGDRWTRTESIVTNGPFQLVAWRPGDRFVFRKNPGYWDAASVHLDGIECYPIDDLATSINLYRSGAIDWNPSGSLPTNFVPYLRKYLDFHTGAFQATYFYSINCTRKPFDDPRVRRALNLAVDRDAIANKLLRGTRPPWGGFLPEGYPGYHNPPGYTYDPGQARRMLAEAGFPDGRGFPKFEILVNTSADHKRIAEAVQEMWRRELHLPVGVTNQEWGSYLQSTTSLHYDVARRSWIGDYLDPTTFLVILRSGDGNNRTGWSDAEYDGLLDRAQSEENPELRMRLLERCEQIVLDRGPLIPIYHYRVLEMWKPYVRGLYSTVLDVHPLKGVWLDRTTGGH